MRILILLMSLLLPSALLAQATVLEVIELGFRNAQDVLPIAQQLVEPNGSVNALENKLVVRATPAQIAQLRTMLEQLDRAPRQLLISVRQSGSGTSSELSADVSGTYRRGDGRIVVPRPDGSIPHQPTLEIEDRQQRSRDSGVQQVRTMEGREAQIQIGASQAYAGRQPGGGTSVEFQEAVTGFTVLPRVNGDIVQLEISPRQDRLQADGSIRIQRINSVVSGRLGEWFDIGGAVQSVTQSSSGLFGGGQSSAKSERSVMVKVEEVD